MVKKKKYIIALVGPSGAGKTSISLAMAAAGIPAVVSYTTRPMRDSETDGVEHIFIDEETADILLKQQRSAAYTEIAGFRYFTLWSQFDKPLMTYVIDEKGLLQLSDSRYDTKVDVYTDKQAYRIDTHIKRMATIITIYIHREQSEIARDVNQARMDRDKERIILTADSYRIHIINDSPDIVQLRKWSASFAMALKAVLTTPAANTFTGVTLNTSDDSTASIINKFNNNLYYEE